MTSSLDLGVFWEQNREQRGAVYDAIRDTGSQKTLLTLRLGRIAPWGRHGLYMHWYQMHQEDRRVFSEAEQQCALPARSYTRRNPLGELVPLELSPQICTGATCLPEVVLTYDSLFIYRR